MQPGCACLPLPPAAGFALVLVSKDACRQALLVALPLLYRFFPLVLRRLWQPPMEDLYKGKGLRDPRLQELPHDPSGNPWDVAVTARFFAYAAIGWAVGELAIRFYDMLGW